MNEDIFNMEIRKFLKVVGVTSQREIDHAVHEAIAAGKIKPDATLKVTTTVSIPAIGLAYEVGGEIKLE